MLNHLVQVELIDLAGLELGEAGTHTLKQYSQLILVVRGDQLSGGAALHDPHAGTTLSTYSAATAGDRQDTSRVAHGGRLHRSTRTRPTLS